MKFFECRYGMKQVKQFNTTSPFMEPGEKIVAKKLKYGIDSNSTIFREYNTDKLQRADFLVYVHDCIGPPYLVILEVKDWDKNFIRSITGDYDKKGKNAIGIKFELGKYGQKNPYRQMINYSQQLSNISNGSCRISIYKIVIFTKLSKIDLKEKLENHSLKENLFEDTNMYTVFSEDINDLLDTIMNKINQQRNATRHYFKEDYFWWNGNKTDVETELLVNNSVNIDYSLDNNQSDIAQGIDYLEKGFVFVYGVVGSGKTLILKKRIDIFKLKKQFNEIEKNKKLLIVMKDHHSLLYKEFENNEIGKKFKNDIIMIPLLPSKFNVAFNETHIKLSETDIDWEEIEEILIEEGQSIISNSEKSFNKLKDLIEMFYLRKNLSAKIIFFGDINQIEYKNYFTKKVSVVSRDLPKVLGLKKEEYFNCFLDLSYRLSQDAAELSYKYYKYYMKKYELLDELVQVTTIGNVFSKQVKETISGVHQDIFENDLILQINEDLKKDNTEWLNLNYSSNLILFMSKPSHIDINESYNIQIIEENEDIEKFDSSKRITICFNPKFISGFEFENVIIFTTPEEFFIEDTGFTDKTAEKLSRNYVSLTRSTGEISVNFYNRNKNSNWSLQTIQEELNNILEEDMNLLNEYRKNK